MSFGCMYIVRGCSKVEEIRNMLIVLAQSHNCGVLFDPVNNLLLEHSVCVEENDAVFEICNSFDSSVADLLLGYDDILYNGYFPKWPLIHRLHILQDFAKFCLTCAETVDIYLGEDSPALADFEELIVSVEDIAEVLFSRYSMEYTRGAFIPCVHLIVTEQQTYWKENSHLRSLS